MKAKLTLIILLTLATALLVLAPTVGAQTVIPGGTIHVGAMEIAGVAADQVGIIAADPRPGVIVNDARNNIADGIRDNTYAETCLEVDAAGKTYIVSVHSGVALKRYFGGWPPDQEQYNPCPSKLLSQGQPQTPGPPSDHYIKSTVPADGETGVSPGVLVKAEFSEPVNGNSVILHFVLKDVNGNTIPATVTYDKLSRTATLDPDIDLAENAQYTATIDARAEGGFMQSAYSWSFTVGSCSSSQVGVPGVTCVPPST